MTDGTHTKFCTDRQLGLTLLHLINTFCAASTNTAMLKPSLQARQLFGEPFCPDRKHFALLPTDTAMLEPTLPFFLKRNTCMPDVVHTRNFERQLNT